MVMNKKTFAFLVLFSVSFFDLFSQFPAKYWVKFTDKNNTPYSISNPSAFLSARSIARRTNQSINIDSTDLPVNQTYVNQVNTTGAVVFQTSKWMNAAIVIVNNSSQLTAINSLTFVLNTKPVGKYINTQHHKDIFIPYNEEKTLSNKQAQVATAYNYGPSFTQANLIGANCMHENGYRGQNMVIAVIDAGFDEADINQVFDSLRNEGRLLGTRDYVAGNTSVYEDFLHGANCLSLMAGNAPGQLIGTAPKASYWLLRSEDAATEKVIEECNWIVAAEFADSVGADITTTSLGYTTFDNTAQSHVYADLNGKNSDASVAATMAARKGIFVLNAAGNEGNSSWYYIGVPADADSICTVGAVKGNGTHASFSSYGPTSDGRIKPDLSSMGENAYVCSPGFNFSGGNGTSYATPILAGAVACLWQANPTKTNMQIMQALKATATQSTTPDNTYGWGIPNVCAAHNYMNGTTIGVKELSDAQQLKLSPNPATNYVSIQVNAFIKHISIYDVLGKEITPSLIKQNDYSYIINFDEQMPNGIYFVTLATNTNFYKTKFIKE